jgi:SOS-response transcriptional repressor LexA
MYSKSTPFSDLFRSINAHEANRADSESVRSGNYFAKKVPLTIHYRVKDDSMIEAGINAGDVVVIEKQSGVIAGDIVLAIVNDVLALGRLAQDRRGYFLQPANRAYAPIRPTGSLEIFGVYSGLIVKGLTALPH